MLAPPDDAGCRSAVFAEGLAAFEEAHATRAVLKPSDLLVADANTGWTRHEAARVVGAVASLDVYIEQPCLTYEESVSIRRRTGLPFILDEVIDGPNMVEPWNDRREVTAN